MAKVVRLDDLERENNELGEQSDALLEEIRKARKKLRDKSDSPPENGNAKVKAHHARAS